MVLCMDRLLNRLINKSADNHCIDFNKFFLYKFLALVADPRRIVILAREHFSGALFNFELILQLTRNANCQFIMRASGGPDKKPRAKIFPFYALPQIREMLAKILREHDGTKQIDPPPEISTELFNYLGGLKFHFLSGFIKLLKCLQS